MKCAALLALVAGCYLGGRGNVDTAVRGGHRGVVPGGAVDLGVMMDDDHQDGELMLSVGTSPLADDSVSRLLMMGFGGRYEHAFVESRPDLRWFGRFLLGFNPCTPRSTDSMDKPTCDDPEERRDAGLLSAAVGVAWTRVADERGNATMPSFGTIGVALVYTYATDAALGTADFVGLELSVGGGGDPISGFKKHD